MSDGEKDLGLLKQIEAMQNRLDKLEDEVQEDREKRHQLEKALVKNDVVLETLTKAIQDLVTRAEFTPVKLIAFGLAASVLSSSIAAIMAGVLK